MEWMKFVQEVKERLYLFLRGTSLGSLFLVQISQK